jgi:glycosyltransferase involved in cell wall biosynthesis
VPEDLRILGIVEGDPSAPLTLSRVPGSLFDALNRRFTVVGRVDYGLRGSRRGLHAAITFRPRRSDWVARFHLTPRAHRALTSTLAQRLSRVRTQFDLVFQIYGWVGGQPHPYFLYVDQTRRQIEAGWPALLPMSKRARAEGRRREREMYLGAQHIFVMGQPAGASLIDDYGISADRITVTAGGLNFSPLPSARPEPVSDPSILFVGREFERKGGEVLLDAFRLVRKRVPSARLHIVGTSRRFTQAGVVGHGLIADRHRLGELYLRTRVLCAPSLYEPWGFVFPEAMAHGIPCIGTNVQSIPEILDYGRAGLLVPPNDIAALADALVLVLEDDGLASRLGKAGRSRVEQHYTWDRVVEAMSPALTSVMGDHRPNQTANARN